MELARSSCTIPYRTDDLKAGSSNRLSSSNRTRSSDRLGSSNRAGSIDRLGSGDRARSSDRADSNMKTHSNDRTEGDERTNRESSSDTRHSTCLPHTATALKSLISDSTQAAGDQILILKNLISLIGESVEEEQSSSVGGAMKTVQIIVENEVVEWLLSALSNGDHRSYHGEDEPGLQEDCYSEDKNMLLLLDVLYQVTGILLVSLGSAGIYSMLCACVVKLCCVYVLEQMRVCGAVKTV